MPELPELENVRRQLAPRLVGRRILAVTVQPQARFGGEAAAGRCVDEVRRRGKYLIADLRDPPLAPLDLVMHLGMTGSFRFRGEQWGGEGAWAGDPYVDVMDGPRPGRQDEDNHQTEASGTRNPPAASAFLSWMNVDDEGARVRAREVRADA